MLGIYYSMASFCAMIIHCLINLDQYRSKKDGSNSIVRVYIAFLNTTFVFYITDFLWGIFGEFGNEKLLYFDTVAYFILLSATVFLSCSYITTYLNFDLKIAKAIQVLGSLFFVFNIVLLVFNYFNKVYFYFDENIIFHVMPMGNLSLGLQILLFLLIAVQTFIIFCNSKLSIKKRSATIGIYCVCMSAAISFQIIKPTVPVYTMGLLIGNCILHIFIYADEKAEYQAKISTANEQLKILNNEQEKRLAEMQNQMKIIKAMSNVYYSSYVIDIKNDTFVELVSKEGIRDVIGSKGRAQDTFNLVCRDIIMPKSQPAMSEFFDLSTLNERLKNKAFITCEYEGTLSGWSQAYFIAGQRNEDGEFERVFYATRIIHDEKEREDEAKAIIEGLSLDYHTMWLVDKETLGMRLIRSDGVTTIKKALDAGLDLKNYNSVCEMYINNFVEAEDRERLRVEASAQEVIGQLEKVDFYTVNFLRRDDQGNVGYHQLAYANADTESGKKQFVVAFRDIDQMLKEEQARKQELNDAKEAAEAASHSKTIFLNNMSHDIRTPMNAILGFTEIMEKNKDNPELVSDYLSKIKISGRYLLAIINNVLDMARIDSGSVTVENKFIDLNDEKLSAIPLLEEMIREKNINFSACRSIKHPYVLLDHTKTQQITVNLLSNAIKYTPEGGSVHMEMNENPCDKEGFAEYELIVSDTGIGMSEEFASHVFDYFSRERNTTESKVMGTGLGMSIVKKLVELMGGSIEVESEPLKGTTFKVKLLHEIVNNPEDYLNANEKIMSTVMDIKGMRILLAEDNDLNAEITDVILREKGFLVERASNGDECVEMLKSAASDYYDLILMDIQMPVMNGYEACAIIRKFDDEVKASIPIVAMTANAFEEDKKSAFASGMNAHIAKPVNVTMMMETLSAHLKNS